MSELFEWRGVRDLVCAKLLTDTADSLSFGDVFSIAGVATLTRATANTSESHYYDNQPAIIIDSTGADTVTITVSGIELENFAKITGQEYDTETGTLVEGSRSADYFALGYKTKKSNGNEVYVWRYKGKFNVPDSTHATETDGTEANGQEIVYTGINTQHKFTKTGKSAKAINVDLEKELCNVDDFFDTVTTIDDLVPNTAATPTATPAYGTITTETVITLSCSTTGATIRYTTDGSTPTASSTTYSAPITFATTGAAALKAIAIKNGMNNSAVLTCNYTVE